MSKLQYFQISHIYKNIFISDIKQSYNIVELLDNNIKAILFLGSKNKSKYILDLYNINKIKHIFLKIDDTFKSDITECFEPSWVFINKNINKNTNVLIHCIKGISRSPAIVAYYLTRKMHERMENIGTTFPVLDDILILIKKSRHCSNPNKFFIKQLKNYENINISKSLIL
jgi:hypothetical protein